MKTAKLALAAFLTSGAVMYAQETKTPKFEVGLEYSWLHVNSANYDFQRTVMVDPVTWNTTSIA